MISPGVRRVLAEIIIVMGIGVVLGGGLGWYFAKPATIVETAAPVQTQADGSIIVQRAPDATAKPKQIVPKGARVERIFQVRAQSRGSGVTLPAGIVLPDGKISDGKTEIPCPPVTIDMTLVREKDGGRRVLASSPDGQIVAAVDVPVDTAAPPPPPKRWAAGVSYNPITQASGIWLERDLGRLRLGLDLAQTRASPLSPSSTDLRVRVGWAF